MNFELNVAGCCLLQEGPQCILLIPRDGPDRPRILSHYKETHGLQHYKGESEEGAISVTGGAQGNRIITAVIGTHTTEKYDRICQLPLFEK